MRINVLAFDDDPSMCADFGSSWLPQSARDWSVFRNAELRDEAYKLLNKMPPDDLELKVDAYRIRQSPIKTVEIGEPFWHIDHVNQEVIADTLRPDGQSFGDCVQILLRQVLPALIFCDLTMKPGGSSRGKVPDDFGLEVLELDCVKHSTARKFLFTRQTEIPGPITYRIFVANARLFQDLEPHHIQISVLRALFERPPRREIARIGSIIWPVSITPEDVIRKMFERELTDPVTDAEIANLELLLFGLVARADPTLRSITSVSLTNLSPVVGSLRPRPVFHMKVSQDSQALAKTIIKLLPDDGAAQEEANYRNYVEAMLPQTLAHGRVIGHSHSHNVSGIVMASSNLQFGPGPSLLDLLLNRDPANPTDVAKLVEEYLKWWKYEPLDRDTTNNRYWEIYGREKVGHSAKALVNCNHLATDLKWLTARRVQAVFNTERKHLTCKNTICHGDLHAENLHEVNQNPFVIDFGRTGEGPLFMDLTQLACDAIVRGFPWGNWQSMKRASWEDEVARFSRMADCVVRASLDGWPGGDVPVTKVLHELFKWKDSYPGLRINVQEWKDGIIQNNLFLLGLSSQSNSLRMREFILLEAASM